MGEMANPTPEVRKATREIAAKVVAAVEEDTRILDAFDGPITDMLCRFAQEITLLDKESKRVFYKK